MYLVRHEACLYQLVKFQPTQLSIQVGDRGQQFPATVMLKLPDSRSAGRSVSERASLVTHCSLASLSDMAKPATLWEVMVLCTAEGCRGYDRWHVEKWLRHERGRSHVLRLAVATIVYKGNRNGDWAHEKSDMPIVVLMSGTTQPVRSEGALLQVFLLKKGVCS